MSKGNLFLGQGRGSVGDVVFYVSGGKQIARSRNRSPRNPKSPRQLYQRAITSTVGRAYQLGKEIFDHSFEGYSVPAGCAERFRSVNARALRSALANDVNSEPTTHVTALVVGPGTLSPVPNAMIISEGTYPMNFWTMTPASESQSIAQLSIPAVSGDETIAAYMSRVGLIVGDIYTFCGFLSHDGDLTVFEVEGADNAGGLQMAGQFFFTRFIVKSPSDPTKLANTAVFGDILDVYTSPNIGQINIMDELLWDESVDFDYMYQFRGDYAMHSMGVIRSRLDNGLRSNSTMMWAKWDNRSGLDWEWALLGWQQGAAALGDSDLLLEGAGYRRYRPTPPQGVYSTRPALPATGTIYITRNDGEPIHETDAPTPIMVSQFPDGHDAVEAVLNVGSSVLWKVGGNTDVSSMERVSGTANLSGSMVMASGWYLVSIE